MTPLLRQPNETELYRRSRLRSLENPYEESKTFKTETFPPFPINLFSERCEESFAKSQTTRYLYMCVEKMMLSVHTILCRYETYIERGTFDDDTSFKIS